MRFTNDAADIVLSVLDQSAAEFVSDGPWRWSSVMQNGVRMAVEASLDDCFLRLVHRLPATPGMFIDTRLALVKNNTLSAGVKLAISAEDNSLLLAADLVILEESQLLNRFQWALDGLHDCRHLLNANGIGIDRIEPRRPAHECDVRDLLRETPWEIEEQGPNDYSVMLDAASSAVTRIHQSDRGVELTVEFVRSTRIQETSHCALAKFLLTASNILRLARAYAEDGDSGYTFGMKVILPAGPTAEEIDHALGALSIAHRMCYRESAALLDERTARNYLAVREI